VATFRKRGNRWQAQVARKGVRRSATFASKAAAKDWAARQEYLILNGDENRHGTLGDLFDRYAREVSPSKRGARWEQLRLEALQKDALAEIRIRDMRPGDFAEWRDRRLSAVEPATVRRELTLMSAVLSVARREWGLVSVNPISDIRKPPNAPSRDRRVTDAEIAKLVATAPDLRKKSGRAVHAFRFAVETAMRAGEICGLRREHITGNVARLAMTKNGRPRDVPLSPEALHLLEPLGDDLFALTPRQLESNFRIVRKAAKVNGLTFHDSRHEGVTRLSKRLDPFELARVVGHTNMSQTLAYYNATAQELAARLAGD